jgi:tetratricopeptide (TPR) repeat protein
VIFQDELADRTQARATLLRVVELDVLYGDAFARLRALLAEDGNDVALLDLLRRRLSHPCDDKLRADLHAEEATLLCRLDRKAEAKRSLRAALEHDRSRVAETRKLAELCLADADYAGAADALIALARITTDASTLAFAFHELGVIYQTHLPDARRAEIAFTRAAQLTPDDPRPIERLVAVFTSGGQTDRAKRALEHLIAMSTDAETRAQHVVRFAEMLLERGEERLAEQALDHARAQAPANVGILDALASLYTRQGDAQALAMHRARSVHALRAGIEERPDHAETYVALIELYRIRDRHDAARQVAYVADVLSVRQSRIEVTEPELFVASPSNEAQVRVHNSGPHERWKNLLRTHEADLVALLPPATVEIAPVPDETFEAARSDVAHLLGSGDELVMSSADQAGVLPLTNAPLHVVVDHALLSALAPDEQRFLLLRAAFIAQQGFSRLVSCDPERLLIVAHALKKLEHPTHAVAAVDDDELTRTAADLRTTLSEQARASVRAPLGELFAEGDPNPRRAAAAALELGGRLALCVTGNLGAALDALAQLRTRGNPRELGENPRLCVVRTDPQARALLSFALSDAYLEARRDAQARATNAPDRRPS